MSVGHQWLGGAGNLSRTDGQLGPDLGFLFCFSCHKVIRVDGGKGAEVLRLLPMFTPMQLDIPTGPLTSPSK